MIAWVSVMKGRDEQGKMVLDKFMTEFFSALLQQVRNFRCPNGMVPQPLDTKILHCYLDNAGVRFIYSMDYTRRDHMTLGGLLQLILLS